MGPSDRNVLEVQGLTVRFDTSERSVVAVKDLGFHVRAGEVLAIVGESGSGKSVTSLSVMRLIEHGGGTIASGKISFTRRNGGKLDLAKAADSVMRTIRGGEISMIFQEPMTSLNPVFSVGTQVAEAVMLHQGLSHAEAEAEALRMLELVRIPEAKQILKRYPHPENCKSTVSDRDGLVLQAFPAYRRRTDDSARRDHSGADPPAHPAAAGRDGHGGHLHHPRHGRGGGGR